jgi:hypothetical protein
LNIVETFDDGDHSRRPPGTTEAPEEYPVASERIHHKRKTFSIVLKRDNFSGVSVVIFGDPRKVKGRKK